MYHHRKASNTEALLTMRNQGPFAVITAEGVDLEECNARDRKYPKDAVKRDTRTTALN